MFSNTKYRTTPKKDAIANNIRSRLVIFLNDFENNIITTITMEAITCLKNAIEIGGSSARSIFVLIKE